MKHLTELLFHEIIFDHKWLKICHLIVSKYLREFFHCYNYIVIFIFTLRLIYLIFYLITFSLQMKRNCDAVSQWFFSCNVKTICRCCLYLIVLQMRRKGIQWVCIDTFLDTSTEKLQKKSANTFTLSYYHRSCWHFVRDY